MPLPRYQPHSAVKRLKSSNTSTNNSIDDKCLAKIIGNALSHSCLRTSNTINEPTDPITGRENTNNATDSNQSDDSFDNGHTTLLRSKLASNGKTIYQIETNDNTLIEHLIKSSEKICSNHVLESFKLSTQVRNFDLFLKLMRSKKLGTSSVKISMELANLDLLKEVRLAIETFRKNRGPNALCQLSLFVKDQKIPDCEEKIKNLVQICRQADVRVYVNALQRISIDCCHLMWSTGRALQGSDSGSKDKGNCVFKITLKTYPLKQSSINPSEITIPLGNNPQIPPLDPKREDLAKHKDILRSLKRDCYNQFVKSVRENNTPVQ